MTMLPFTPATRPERPRQRPQPIDPDRYACLGELLHDALVQFKSATALVEMDRRQEKARWTYLDVKHAAEALAGRLASWGIGPDDRVAILMSNQSKWLVSACAALFRGAILVPIDYKLEPAEQRALIEHCGARVLVTEYPMWRRLGAEHAVERVVVTEAPDDADLGEARRWEDGRRGPRRTQDTNGAEAPEVVPRGRDDVAATVYSSGTGGRPKGCMLTHANYLAQYGSLSRLFSIVTGDRYFSILPTNHAFDFMVGFIGPFCGGATVVHQRTLRPEFVRDTIKRCHITHMSVVPLVLTAFERTIREKLEQTSPGRRQLFDGLQALNAALTAKRPMHTVSRRLLAPVHEAFGSELRLIISGGAYVDPDRARFFYDLGIPVVIGYGLTEAGTAVTVNDLSPFRSDSVGKPLPGMEVEIRDSDPDTGVGEIFVRGPTVMKGYLDAPELTAETLIDGWLRTGDSGWLDASGHLHIVGRRKNMIVTAGGKNVYPEDIESALEGLPCEELVVMASGYLWPGGELPDEKLIVVVRDAREGFVDALRERNRGLPGHKRVGGVLEWRRPFPRTASMKVQREALAETLRHDTSTESVDPLK